MPKIIAIIFFVLEIAVFILVGKLLGFGWAIVLLLAGCIAGGVVLQRANLGNMQNLQERIMKGEMPLKQMMNAPFLMIAGFLLLIPGFITDVLGLLCLLPFTRKLLMRWLMNSSMMKKAGMHGMNMNVNMNMQQNMKKTVGKKPQQAANDDKTIEGEFWEGDDKKD